VDILKTDAVEARALTGAADFRAACRALGALGPKEVVLTHRDGLVVMAGGRFYEERFFPRQLAGRSGRGDTCIASYVGRRLAAEPAEAARWAAALTSLKMEREGPFRGTLREVEEALLERGKA
jgi:sugar/nucleoside kinase (ribokinase family)